MGDSLQAQEPPQPLFGIPVARALISGPEGSPEQAGEHLERWAVPGQGGARALRQCCATVA